MYFFSSCHFGHIFQCVWHVYIYYLFCRFRCEIGAKMLTPSNRKGTHTHTHVRSLQHLIDECCWSFSTFCCDYFFGWPKINKPHCLSWIFTFVIVMIVRSLKWQKKTNIQTIFFLFRLVSWFYICTYRFAPKFFKSMDTYMYYCVESKYGDIWINSHSYSQLSAYYICTGKV